MRLGLIGAGRIGRIHGTNAARRIPGCALAAIADLNEDAAQACAAATGVDAVFTDPQAIFDDPAIDAVIICSATQTHVPLIEAAAGAGKHIFCEKPVALELAAVDRAMRAVEAAGVKAQVGFNRRFDPSFAELQRALAGGAIGTPHLVRITSRDPAPPPIEYVRISGGLFYDMTIHDFDMARFIVGAEVESVFATGSCRVDPAIGEAGDIDTAVVVLTFAGGVVCTIDNCRKADYGYDQRVEVLGADGMLQADNRTPHGTSQADSSGVHGPRLLDFFLERYEQAYLHELEAFVAAVRDDAKPPVCLDDGRAPVVLAKAAYRSIELRRAVLPSEVDQV